MTLEPEPTNTHPVPPCAGERKQTVKPFIKRGEALSFALIFFAALLFSLYAPTSAWLKYAGAVISLLCVLVFLIPALAGARRLRGVRRVEGGFEHFAGIKGRRLVRFDDMERIVGVQTGGGATGDEVVFEIFGQGWKVLITEEDLFGTDLHSILYEMPGFDRNQYSLALSYQLKGLEHVCGKRFDLYKSSVRRKTQLEGNFR